MKRSAVLPIFSLLLYSVAPCARAELVAHFPLDSDSSAAVGGFTAAIDDGITFDETGANANTGNAASFDGGSVLQFDWDEELNPESFTFMAWAKPNNGADDFQSLITSRNDLNPDSEGYVLYYGSDGNWQYWSGNGTDGGNWQILPGDPVETDTWQHVAIVYDNDLEEKSLYLNGELTATAQDRIEPNTDTPLNIGAGQDFGDGFFFDGLIDDIGLYNEALSEADISFMMENGVQEVTVPPLRISVASRVDLDLGNAPSTVTLKIENTGGTDDLVISGAVLSGAQGALFTPSALPEPIEAGDSIDWSLAFDPADHVGPVTAILTISSNDPNKPDAVVELKGRVPNPNGPSLIAHFPLDADGDSIDGSFVAALEEDVDFGEPGANGATGTSASFNGSSSRIQHDWSEALNPESFTLTLWAKSNGGAAAWNSPVTSRHDLVGDGEASQGYLIYDAQQSGAWTFWSGNGDDPGNWQALNGPEVMLDEWEHLAITYDDELEVKKLYVNGEVVAEADDSIFPNDTTPLNIGSGQDFGGGFWFEGLIDDIGIWDGALTDSQINLVMSSGVAAFGSDPGLQIPGLVNLELNGADQNFTVTVRNSGLTLPLEVTGINVTGDDGDKFTISTTFPITLAPGASTDVAFSFAPAGATGQVEATFSVLSNDAQIESFPVAISGLIQDPRIEAPMELGFGVSDVPSTRTLEIKNLGATKPLTIGEVTVTGSDKANFTVDAKPTTIPVGGTGMIEVTFDPLGLEGSFLASLAIASNDPGAALINLPIFASVTVTNPLVAFWPLDTDGTSADGRFVPTTEEGVEFEQEGARPFTGQSTYFDGSGVIQFDHTLDLNPESFTLTVWAKSEGGAGAWNSVVTSRHDLNAQGEASEGFILYDSEPAGDWRFWHGNGDAAGNWIQLVGPEVNLEEWDHIVLRYDNSTVEKSLFVNGELIETQEDPVAQNQETPFNIGAGQDFGNGFWFLGNIDNMALFRTALTDEEVDQIYNNGVEAFLGNVSVFQILDIDRDTASENITISFTSTPGASYIIERSSDLSNWLELADGVEGEEDATSFLDDSPKNAAPALYYRVKSE